MVLQGCALNSFPTGAQCGRALSYHLADKDREVQRLMAHAETAHIEACLALVDSQSVAVLSCLVDSSVEST